MKLGSAREDNKKDFGSSGFCSPGIAVSWLQRECLLVMLEMGVFLQA